ncbi:MAG: DUF2726 domain-containing protein [Pseudomonas sp.]|uniref:DUF2726 domain-containing protein n=1 Tax=Pseudomonas sp. TaxID=306 RepID=UPI001213B3ED|nr:DUF2726 domain-containing protein [Pseudomonas sp.]RZI76783.1 MAG: DUF2726 domain-containing protein [Pseudomonas sp.]
MLLTLLVLAALVILFFAASLVLFMLRSTASQGGINNGFLEIIPHAQMSEAEKRLFEILELAMAPSFLVCPRVTTSAVVTRPSHHNPLRYRAIRSQKRLDFVLVDRETLNARLLVELDDMSRRNRKADDGTRHGTLAEAGYPTLRVLVRQTYNMQDLSTQIRMAMGQQ